MRLGTCLDVRRIEQTDEQTNLKRRKKEEKGHLKGEDVGRRAGEGGGRRGGGDEKIIVEDTKVSVKTGSVSR